MYFRFRVGKLLRGGLLQHRGHQTSYVFQDNGVRRNTELISNALWIRDPMCDAYH